MSKSDGAIRPGRHMTRGGKEVYIATELVLLWAQGGGNG